MITDSIQGSASASRGNPVAALSAFATHGYDTAREAARASLGLIHECVGLRICMLTRVDLAANTLTVLEAYDRAGLGVAAGMVLPADEMPCGFVVRTAAALREFDLDAHPTFRQLPVPAKLGLRSYIGVPLKRSDGRIWGTLAATDTRTSKTTEAHLHTLTILARLAVLEFEREERRNALAVQARIFAERLAMVEELEEERLRAARMQAVLEAAAAVSHEANNSLMVLQLRLGQMAKRFPANTDTAHDIEVSLAAADEIHQVTAQLRNLVRALRTRHALGPKDGHGGA